MRKPQISVIIPVYNMENYITKIVDCIRKQSFRDFECLLVDDGSTDLSMILSESFALTDDVFTVIHIKNYGVSHARNVGLDLARGNYVTFIDSDDEVSTDYISKIVEDISFHAVDLVIGHVIKVNELGLNIETKPNPFDMRVYTLEELLPRFAEIQKEYGIFGWCVNKTFKRELANECHFDETLTLYEDFDFYLKLYSRIHTIYFDNCLTYYYISERSNFSKFSDSQIDYFAQARVNIRYKNFLVSNCAWYGNNNVIVSNRILTFIFLAIFHCRMDRFNKYFERAKDLLNQAEICIPMEGKFMSVVLFLVSKGRIMETKLLINSYRFARRIIKG